MTAHRPKFKVGQVISTRLTGRVGRIQFRYQDSSGSKVWWYELDQDATPLSEDEVRPLTKRERGA
jgi:hypothetical protein